MSKRGSGELPRVPLILTMAVGPGELLGAMELLDSARAFLRSPYRAIVVDDTGDLTTWLSLRRYREVTVLRNWRRRGFTRLLASLQRAYRQALRSYDFAAILKVDTDALITGPDVDADILAFIRVHPRAGMIGSRSWPDRADHVWRHALEENQVMWSSLLQQAKEQGYMPGESVLGGAYVLSRECVAALDEKGYLDLVPTGPRVAEDVTFSLLTQAAGFELHELAGPDQPFALAWRGLPMPPEQVLAQGKKVVHSVKLDALGLSIRRVFARNRRRHVAAVAHLAEDTIALAARTHRLRIWCAWKPVAARALRENRPLQARRLLRRCARIFPAKPMIWAALVVTFLPRLLRRPLQGLRTCAISALGQLREHVLRPEMTPRSRDGQPYTLAFYERQSAGSRGSAGETVPLLLQWLSVSSVVDVGCGIGTWLAVFREHGVTDVLGLDGQYVDRNQLRIPASQFRPTDLTSPPPLDRVFDLAVSIEVAEHLPASAADTFIRYLTALAPVVLFSAAVPGQGGTNHLNEQWPEYWAARFVERGFVTIDCLRPLLWHRENVQWWHAQNVLLFVEQRCLEAHPLLRAMADRTDSRWLARVHPRAYAQARGEARELHERLRPENMSARQLLRCLPTALLRALRRRFR